MPPGMTIWPEASTTRPAPSVGEAAGRADRDDVLADDANIGRLRARGKDGKTVLYDDVEHLSLLRW